jgi:UPF0755 protein
MRRSSPRAAIIAVLLFGLIFFGIAVYAWNTATDVFQPVTVVDQGKTIPVEIANGETTAQIGENLQNKGLIRNALAFRIWARVKGLDTHLQAGIYKKINSSMTIDKIIDELLNAQPDAIRVVIPEGWRIEQIADRFANSNLVKFKQQDFLKYTKHVDQFPDKAKYPLLNAVPRGQSMEGLLFPASYEIPVDADAAYVVNIMLKTTNTTIQENHLDTLAQQHRMSVYRMLTLASIVERETLFSGDRGNIASVYWNRIYQPSNETVGLLQADPTVQYARDTSTPPNAAAYWKPLATAGGDTATTSLWNTYTHKDLPPTPICSPGLASMQVAANPPKTAFYYFFAKKGGHSVFAKTNQEFEQLKQQYNVNNG